MTAMTIRMRKYIHSTTIVMRRSCMYSITPWETVKYNLQAEYAVKAGLNQTVGIFECRS